MGIYKVESIQALKNEMITSADATRIYHQGYEKSVEFIYRVCDKVKGIGGFSANIAETVEKSIGKYMKAAYISEKQAYCMARAIFDAGITEITYCDNL